MNRNRNITFRSIVSEHLSEAKWSLLAAGLAMLGFTVTELIAPWPLKIIFDHILLNQPLPASLSALGGILQSGKGYAVVVISIGILLIAGLKGAFSYGQLYLTSLVGYRMVYTLRRELFAHLQQPPPDPKTIAPELSDDLADVIGEQGHLAAGA